MELEYIRLITEDVSKGKTSKRMLNIIQENN